MLDQMIKVQKVNQNTSQDTMAHVVVESRSHEPARKEAVLEVMR